MIYRLFLIVLIILLTNSFVRADEIATSVYRKIEAYYPLEGNVNEVLTNDFLRLDKGLLNFSEGHKGMALHCIGDSNYFAVPNVFADLISGNSLSLWFYVDSLPNRYQSLIDKTYRSDFTLKVTSDSMLTFRILSARNIEFETKTKVNVKEWYFVVVSVEDNVMSFYLNGQLIERSPLRNLKNNNYSAIVGAGGIPYAPGYQFYGKIDELCFFHAGLSLEEVDYLYKTGIELNTVFVRLHDLTDLPKELHDRWKNYPHLDVLIDSTLKTALLETKNNQLSTAELWRILNAKMDALGFKPPDNITKAQPTASFPKHLKEKREKQAKNLKYLYLVLGILILVIVFIFVFKGRLRRYVNGNKDYEGLTNELSLKEETLSQFAVQIVEKNKFIHQIGLDLKEIRKSFAGEKNMPDIIALETKINQVAIRPKDQKEFDTQAKAYNEVFTNLIKKKFDSLTRKDLRLIELLRVGMSSKEIATILNISPKSVDTSRHRLRRKLNLHADDNLIEYLRSIH